MSGVSGVSATPGSPTSLPCWDWNGSWTGLGWGKRRCRGVSGPGERWTAQVDNDTSAPARSLTGVGWTYSDLRVLRTN